jgi:serine/threonine protein kinase
VKLIDVVFPAAEDDGRHLPTILLVQDFVESNLSLVVADTRRPLCELIPRFYFTQILYGVGYLHHIGIMHRVCCSLAHQITTIVVSS